MHDGLAEARRLAGSTTFEPQQAYLRGLLAVGLDILDRLPAGPAAATPPAEPVPPPTPGPPAGPAPTPSERPKRRR